MSKDVNQNDLATIVYTSGTTGMPKGAMITHKNFLSQIESLEKIFDINSEDTAISFLPMAHIFERMVVFFYISKNVSVFFVNDVKNLVVVFDNAKDLEWTSYAIVFETENS
jgi:long-chain acyl-CoA synthetase